MRRLSLILILLASVPTWGQESRYLRIGAGPPGESHFTLAGIIGSAISAPPGLPPCGQGGPCGVPGLLAVASATNGSVADAQAIEEGRLEAALMQADVPVWAVAGQAPFEGRSISDLRSIGALGLDQLQLVVLRDGPIHSMRDLRNRRISLGEPGSGTQAIARKLLNALGFKPGEVKEDNIHAAIAADRVQAGTLDGFFVLDAAPVPSIAELAKRKPVRLIPITGPATEKLRKTDPLLVQSRVPAGTYQGIDSDAPTVAVALTLVVSGRLPDDLVYGITKALWRPDTLQILSNARPGTPPITFGSARAGIGLPFHPAALRYYAEQSMIK